MKNLRAILSLFALVAIFIVGVLVTTGATAKIRNFYGTITIGQTNDAVAVYGKTPLAQQTGPAALTNGAASAEIITAVNGIRSNLVAFGVIK
jgi:hypothetical protein